MASPILVKIHEVTKITPSSDSTSELSLPLTCFDTFWLNFHPVERLFFYKIGDITPHFFNSVILPKLKKSLSVTLFHYLPLAGNLVWPADAPKPTIYYFAGDGVSVTVAESNADFNFLAGNGIREAVAFPPLIPRLLVSDDKAATIAIQITLFPNQGFCIGIATHHAILDGKSSIMFMKSWAYLCKQDKEDPSLSADLTPSFDRSVIKDPAGMDMVYLNNWLAFSGSDSNPNRRTLKILPSLGVDSNMVHATFELTPEDINKLRDKVLSTSDKVDENEVKKSELHLSSFALTCAYVFVCIVKATVNEGNRNTVVGFVADYRTRLDPPIPANYFGNCVGAYSTVAKARDFMEETGVSFVVEKLSDQVKRLQRGVKGLDLLELVEMTKLGAKSIAVAGSNRFDVYGTDFGWGRPKKVEIVSIARNGSISLAESRDGSGGVEVGVVLEKQEMEFFTCLFADGLKY